MQTIQELFIVFGTAIILSIISSSKETVNFMKNLCDFVEISILLLISECVSRLINLHFKKLLRGIYKLYQISKRLERIEESIEHR